MLPYQQFGAAMWLDMDYPSRTSICKRWQGEGTSPCFRFHWPDNPKRTPLFAYSLLGGKIFSPSNLAFAVLAEL